MSKPLTIDFVSDIACPWCAVGLSSLLQAIQRCENVVSVSLHIHPFELNPGMSAEGEELVEHLRRKYGSTPEQQAQMRQTIAERGAAVGFTFHQDGRGRIVNTFNAHRLLHWAGTQSALQQLHLKRALLEAYHGRAERVDHDAVLLAAVKSVGLDSLRVQQILATDEFADDVRQAEQQWQANGIQSVPAIIINQQYLISGGQPPEVFEQALRQIAAES
jgi:predicted DsbA family dithiol-disulfide isomerase